MFFRIATKNHEILRIDYHAHRSDINQQFSSYTLYTKFEKVFEHWRASDHPAIDDFLNKVDMYVAMDNTWS